MSLAFVLLDFQHAGVSTSVFYPQENHATPKCVSCCYDKWYMLVEETKNLAVIWNEFFILALVAKS